MLMFSMLVFTVVSIMYSQHDAAGLSSFNAAGRCHRDRPPRNGTTGADFGTGARSILDFVSECVDLGQLTFFHAVSGPGWSAT